MSDDNVASFSHNQSLVGDYPVSTFVLSRRKRSPRPYRRSRAIDAAEAGLTRSPVVIALGGGVW